MNKLIHLSARALAALLIAAPLLLYAAYLVGAASDRYVSESVVTVRQDSGDASGIPGAALLLAGISSPSHADTMMLMEFVHSQDLMLKLEKKLGLREHYRSAKLDLPYRLSADASLEDFTDFYRQRVEVQFDDRSSLLHLRVQAFDPAFAQRLDSAILEESERFVNETSHRIARERLRFAEGELGLAGERLEKARNQMLAFQGRHRLLDPTLQAQASGALTAELEASRSRLEAELNGMLGFLNDEAYQVKALRGRISALNKQIEAEGRRATTSDRKGARLNELSIEFQGLQLQAEFARDAYKLALAAVENARIESTRKLKTLVVVASPSLPQTAEYPRVTYNLATLLAFCIMLYAIVRLVLATIREHQD